MKPVKAVSDNNAIKVPVSVIFGLVDGMGTGTDIVFVARTVGSQAYSSVILIHQYMPAGRCYPGLVC